MKSQQCLDIAKHSAMLGRRDHRNTALTVSGRHSRLDVDIDQLAQTFDVSPLGRHNLCNDVEASDRVVLGALRSAQTR